MNVPVASLEQYANAIASLHTKIDRLTHENRQLKTCGFTDGLRYVHIEKNGKYLWHEYDESQEKKAIKAESLRGFVRKVSITKSDRLEVIIVGGDRDIALQSGKDTNFSKSILASLAQLGPQNIGNFLLIRPDTIEPKDDSTAEERKKTCQAGLMQRH